jgi:D-sedoheptulose 7-phosphate isomerase
VTSDDWLQERGRPHLERVLEALGKVEPHLPRVHRWAQLCTTRLVAGGKLLAAGNGGSAAHAQHLTAELVGRYRDERPPLAAIVLHGDTSAMTAIVNDYGADEMFRRQVHALGTPLDVFVAFSTSGRSPNLVLAAHAARAAGLLTLAVCGPPSSPLAAACEDAMTVDAPDTPAIQEVHQVLVHLLCDAIDHELMGARLDVAR